MSDAKIYRIASIIVNVHQDRWTILGELDTARQTDENDTDDASSIL
jgi:hypothetical protein